MKLPGGPDAIAQGAADDHPDDRRDHRQAVGDRRPASTRETRRRRSAKPTVTGQEHGRGGAATTSAPTCGSRVELARRAAASSCRADVPGRAVLRRLDPRAGRGRAAELWASSTRGSRSRTRARCPSSSPRASRRRPARGRRGDADGEHGPPSDRCRRRLRQRRDRLRRSRLYLPGNEPKFFVNAGLSRPDGDHPRPRGLGPPGREGRRAPAGAQRPARRRLRRRRAHGAHQPAAAGPRGSRGDRPASGPT